MHARVADHAAVGIHVIRSTAFMSLLSSSPSPSSSSFLSSPWCGGRVGGKEGSQEAATQILVASYVPPRLPSPAPRSSSSLLSRRFGQEGKEEGGGQEERADRISSRSAASTTVPPWLELKGRQVKFSWENEPLAPVAEPPLPVGEAARAHAPNP